MNQDRSERKRKDKHRDRDQPRERTRERDKDRDDEDDERERKRERHRDEERETKTREREKTRTRERETRDDVDHSDLRREIERLEKELSRRDRELEDEKDDNEQKQERLKRLEREKYEMRREIEDLKEEAQDYKKSFEEMKDKYSILANKEREENEEDKQTLLNSQDEAIRMKNDEINQLLLDLEGFEEENTLLKDKLKDLKDSLEQATKQIESLSTNQIRIKDALDMKDLRVNELEKECQIMKIKQKDAAEFKERNDKYLDNLSSAVDIRVEIWKKMMFEKDSEIEKLHEQMNSLLTKMPNSGLDSDRYSIKKMESELIERESQIDKLNEKLEQATEEIESNVAMMKKLQERLRLGQDTSATEKLINALKGKLKRAEHQSEKEKEISQNCEKEAEEKSKEVISLKARLNAFTSGEYGLSSAIGEIKELKNQLQVRNNQVERVTKEINDLQMLKNDLLDENEMMRRKLGIPSNADLTKETKKFIKNKKSEMSLLKSQIAQKDEEITQLKSKNYFLKKQVNSVEENPQGKRRIAEVQNEPKAVSENTEEWRERYITILDENTELRKGLQEILDSIHQVTENGATDVSIQSPTLENLLREMSSRGLIHYPHSITSFHLKVCNLEGKNSQLREDLHLVRQEERKLRDELIEAKSRIHYLEEKIDNLNNTEGSETQKPETSQIPLYKSKSEGFSVSSPSQSRTTFDELKLRGITFDKVLEMINGMTNAPSDTLRIIQDAKSEILQWKSSVNQEELKRLRNLEEKYKSTTSREIPQLQSSTSSIALDDKCSQTDFQIDDTTEELTIKEKEMKEMILEKESLELSLKTQKLQIESLMREIEAKNHVMSEIELFKSSSSQRVSSETKEHNDEVREALQVAQEIISSLQERMKAKDENVNQYRSLLAELRTEMTGTTDRHIQEMRALQLTIYQQQQAFAKMKGSMCKPVKDTLTVEETFKDQLTRINELEEEVSELQHTLGNVASQLTSARSDAHRWRVTAEGRLKELDSSREHMANESIEEMQSLRQKIKEQNLALDQFRSHLNLKSPKEISSLANKVEALMRELAEKDQEIELYTKTLKKIEKSNDEKAEKHTNEPKSDFEELKEENKTLKQKVSSLQIRLNKLTSTQKKSDLEELRQKYIAVQQEKIALQKKLDDTEIKHLEEQEKRKKALENMIRWEETKKWKKNVEKLEGRNKTLEFENEKSEKTMKSLRLLISRLEKDKSILETRMMRGLEANHPRKADEGLQGENERLKIEIEDAKEQMERIDFEGKEEVEKLKMEVKCLKDRILSQERQLTAHQIVNKGDPKMVSEIEKMANMEEKLHKEIIHLEEENLHLKLQIEQLRLDTPRLRDRVQQLTRLVDDLKKERSNNKGVSNKCLNSTKNLGELERTIGALKQVIEKLHHENKQLKIRPTSKLTSSNERIKESLETLMRDKENLMATIKEMEEKAGKYEKMYIEATENISILEVNLKDSERKAKSLEVKLRSFLDNEGNVMIPQSDSGRTEGNEHLYKKIRQLQEDLDRKSKLLNGAKLALKDAASSTNPKNS